jgi:hypothetical protein
VLEDNLMLGPREGLTQINSNRLRGWTSLVNAHLKPRTDALHLGRHIPFRRNHAGSPMNTATWPSATVIDVVRLRRSTSNRGPHGQRPALRACERWKQLADLRLRKTVRSRLDH